MYNDPTCKPWTSSHWAPEGFDSRDELVAQDRAAQAHRHKSPEGVEEGRHETVEEGKAGEKV